MSVEVRVVKVETDELGDTRVELELVANARGGRREGVLYVDVEERALHVEGGYAATVVDVSFRQGDGNRFRVTS